MNEQEGWSLEKIDVQLTRRELNRLLDSFDVVNARYVELLALVDHKLADVLRPQLPLPL